MNSCMFEFGMFIPIVNNKEIIPSTRYNDKPDFRRLCINFIKLLVNFYYVYTKKDYPKFIIYDVYKEQIILRRTMLQEYNSYHLMYIYENISIYLNQEDKNIRSIFNRLEFTKTPSKEKYIKRLNRLLHLLL